MLQKVSVGIRSIDKYHLVLSRDLMDEVVTLARELRGLRVCHINSTPFGGGVAEMLVSYIPLLQGLGIHADWQIIRGDREFFTITKALHNALQGKPYPDIESPSTRSEFLRHNLANARELDLDYDVFVVNDPQPVALRRYARERGAKWIWRCHVDSSEPDEAVWQFLRPFIEEYDAAVFTMDKFVPRDLCCQHIGIIAPAIDPFSSKNMMLRRHTCRSLLENMGLDKSRFMVVQVSRFDHWKDPFGVMEAYRLAKWEVPGLQMIFVGSFAHDDPEAWELYSAMNEEANKDDDMWVFSNLTGVGNMEVNAFQTAADVVIQKSLREGFGLVVTEALWKGIPVVAGNAGGIPLQMGGRLKDFLVNSTEECAQKMVFLLQNQELAREIGLEGREYVKRRFLMPRLIRDELALMKGLLGR